MLSLQKTKICGIDFDTGQWSETEKASKRVQWRLEGQAVITKTWQEGSSYSVVAEDLAKVSPDIF